MHCPECKALNVASAAACSTCGLLLLNLQKPVEKKRRSEDFAVEKRRASDKSETPCRFDVVEVWLVDDASTPRLALHQNAFDYCEGSPRGARIF